MVAVAPVAPVIAAPGWVATPSAVDGVLFVLVSLVGVMFLFPLGVSLALSWWRDR